MPEYTNDYLLDKQIKIFQPLDGYRASSDAVMLSSMVQRVKIGERILDLGSGTGAISLCLAHRFPQAEITGFEIQPELEKLSNLSAEANGFVNLRFVNCDIRQPQTKWFGQYHHVITNPPYSANDMPSPNAGKACAHNFQNFNLTAWLNIALKCLTPQGRIYTVNRTEAIDEILAAFYGRAGAITIIPLYSKSGQDAKRVLISARKNDHSPSRILQGLTIHNDDGTYTAAAQKILRAGKSMFD
uniref:Methyltransferase n=1 Tax=uncultured Alphaproteobacteria bacterium TaxID=91750 RepID=A0A6G8F2H1_9PROT|nr:methyltransferase [uncultured Alphaproteobacteria bacterium]